MTNPKVNLDLIGPVAQQMVEEAERNPPRNAWKDRSGFNVVSMKEWLGVVSHAGIPHVPAEHIATIDIDMLMRFDHIPPPAEVRSFYEKVEAAKEPDTMLRWDCCAPLDIKQALGNGQPEWSSYFIDYFTIDDPRAFDLIYEQPCRDTCVWKRPWVKARIADSYPVEFRVFVDHGAVAGVSSYYPQRPLVDSAEIREHVAISIRYAEALCEYVYLPIRAPAGIPEDRFATRKSFTVDVMVLESGEVLWLEGGPPYYCRAHGCCFDGLEIEAWSDHADFHLGPVPVALSFKGEELR